MQVTSARCLPSSVGLGSSCHLGTAASACHGVDWNDPGLADICSGSGPVFTNSSGKEMFLEGVAFALGVFHVEGLIAKRYI